MQSANKRHPKVGADFLRRLSWTEIGPHNWLPTGRLPHSSVPHRPIRWINKLREGGKLLLLQLTSSIHVVSIFLMSGTISFWIHSKILSAFCGRQRCSAWSSFSRTRSSLRRLWSAKARIPSGRDSVGDEFDCWTGDEDSLHQRSMTRTKWLDFSAAKSQQVNKVMPLWVVEADLVVGKSLIVIREHERECLPLNVRIWRNWKKVLAWRRTGSRSGIGWPAAHCPALLAVASAMLPVAVASGSMRRKSDGISGGWTRRSVSRDWNDVTLVYFSHQLKDARWSTPRSRESLPLFSVLYRQLVFKESVQMLQSTATQRITR